MRMKLPKMAPAPKVRRYRWSSRAACAVFCCIYILYIPPYHMVLQVMLQVERTNSHSGSAQITELVQ